MNLIGFNLTKIQAERFDVLKKANLEMDIKFLNVVKEKVNILKESEAVKITFKKSLIYKDPTDKDAKEQAKILFEGKIILSLTKEESKDILKSWKKKQLPPNIGVYLSNLIIKRCASKAFQLQDELNLPSHLKIPSVSNK